MLVIREDQMRALRQSRRQMFLDRLVTHLLTHCPAACAETSAAALSVLADRELRRGMAFGLRAERDLVVFVSLMIVVGTTRDTPAWLAQVQQYLTDARVPEPGERVARLYSATLKRLEVEARNRRILEELGHVHAG